MFPTVRSLAAPVCPTCGTRYRAYGNGFMIRLPIPDGHVPGSDDAGYLSSLRCAWMDISTPNPASNDTADVPP